MIDVTFARKVSLSLFLGFIMFLASVASIRLSIFDEIFGMAFFVVKHLGIWHPGPSWLQNHPAIAITCLLVWPLTVCWLYSYGVVSTATKLWKMGKIEKKVTAVAIVFIALCVPYILGWLVWIPDFSWSSHIFVNY